MAVRPVHDVSRQGSVLGEGEQFLLWIDLKQSDDELLEALHALLARYPMLARFGGTPQGSGPVVAILTGDPRAKRAYAARPGVRYACRDSNELDLDFEADRLHLWYALPWDEFFSWDGAGPMPRRERNRLRALSSSVHRLGRKLRLYRLPESEAVWRELLTAGVDLIGTDQPARLGRFLAGPLLAGSR